MDIAFGHTNMDFDCLGSLILVKKLFPSYALIRSSRINPSAQTMCDFYQDYFGFTRRKEGNEVFDTGASFSFLRDIGAYSKLITQLSFYFGDKNIPVSGYSSNYAEQRDLSSRVNLMLDMGRAFHDDFSMELVLGHAWKRLTYDPGSVISRHDENNFTLINRWGWYPGTKFTLRFGGDYRFIDIDSSDTGGHTANRGGLHITGEYSPVENLLLIASLKGTTDGRLIIPVPKIGASWKLNDNITLKNNYFRSFKFPDFDDLYWAEDGFTGNPDLENEDGWGFDISAEFFSGRLLSIDSTVYGQWTLNSIHWNSSSGEWRPENYGEAVFFGWDNRLKLTLPLSHHYFQEPAIGFSWTWQPSRLLSGGLSPSDNIRIPYMPAHILTMSFELPWESVNKKLPGSLLVSGRFESSRYTNTGNTVALEAHFLLNIAYNQRLNDSIGFFGKINNALNAKYVSFADYPMPGISITVGVNMAFDGTGN